ncbi:hypothetical protein BJ508DRAFT_316450, partial [Ascobolus immersus RN42]
SAHHTGFPSSDAPVPSSDTGFEGTDTERKAKRQRTERRFYAGLTEGQKAVMKSRELETLILHNLWYLKPFFHVNSTTDKLATMFRDKFLEFGRDPTHGTDPVLWNTDVAKECKKKGTYFSNRSVAKVKEFLNDPTAHAYDLSIVQCEGKRTTAYLTDHNRLSVAPQYYSHPTPNMFTFTSPEIVNFIYFYFFETDKAYGYSKYNDWAMIVREINGTFLSMVCGILKAGLKQWPFSKGSHISKGDWEVYYEEFLKYWKLLTDTHRNRL